MRISQQIKQNAVALISLMVAISALSYTGWRNEISESNRNVRAGGFAMFQKLSEFETTVLDARYGQQINDDQVRRGWTLLLALEDLAYVMPDDIMHSTLKVKAVWSVEASRFHQDEESFDRLNGSIDDVRKSIRNTLDGFKIARIFSY